MRQRIVILGGSGHARVIADILEERDDIEIAAFVATDSAGEIHGYPVIRDDSALEGLFRSGVSGAFVAIGDNARRRECSRMVRGLGFNLINAVSIGARVSKRATLGKGIAVMAGAVINTGAVVCDGAIINSNSCLEHDCFAGCWSHLASGASTAGKARLEEGAFLGTGVSVRPGISIGAWALVGAGSVVVSNIPALAVAYGNPARVHKYRVHEGEWSTEEK